jgi:hypothetical protein
MKKLLIIAVLSSFGFAQLPDAPTRVIDKKFLVSTFANFSAAYTDAYVSHAFIRPEAGCHEINPILGPYPSIAKNYGLILGTWVIVTGVSYLIKRKYPHTDYWAYPPIVEAGIHGIGIRATFEHCKH